MIITTVLFFIDLAIILSDHYNNILTKGVLIYNEN